VQSRIRFNYILLGQIMNIHIKMKSRLDEILTLVKSMPGCALGQLYDFTNFWSIIDLIKFTAELKEIFLEATKKMTVRRRLSGAAEFRPGIREILLVAVINQDPEAEKIILENYDKYFNANKADSIWKTAEFKVLLKSSEEFWKIASQWIDRPQSKKK